MKFSIPATILFLAVTSSALPFNGADISQIERRQVPVQEAAMASNGVIVPYSNPAGKAKRMAERAERAEKEKKAKRQVPVQEAAMATNGVIVPYSNDAAN